MSQTLTSLQVTSNTGLKIGNGSTITTFSNSATVSRTLSLPDASDMLIGRSTSDTLINKTITASTNTVSANSLKTSGSDVNISTAAPPSSGQILTATSPTLAIWQDISIPGTSLSSGSITTNNSTSTTIETLSISTPNKTYLISSKISAYNTTDNNAGAYKIEGAFVNIAGTISSLDLPMISSWISISSPFTQNSSIAFQISGTNILIQVTGAASKSINWKSATSIVLSP